MIDLPDDFEAHARGVLGSQDPELLNKLLALRAEIHQYLLVPWPGETPSAETLNARNQHMLDQAAKLLGKDKFTQVFGCSPDEKINLVDPSIQSQTK